MHTKYRSSSAYAEFRPSSADAKFPPSSAYAEFVLVQPTLNFHLVSSAGPRVRRCWATYYYGWYEGEMRVGSGEVPTFHSTDGECREVKAGTLVRLRNGGVQRAIKKRRTYTGSADSDDGSGVGNNDDNDDDFFSV